MRVHRSNPAGASIPALAALVLLAFAPGARANQPPKAVASAGVDLSTGEVLDSVIFFMGPADTGRLVTIAGGGSSDPDLDPLTYRWECTDLATDGKCIFAGAAPKNQPNLVLTFPPGIFSITLTVDDGQGHSATDSVRVKVLLDTSPPRVTPPEDTTVSATELDGARVRDSAELRDFLFDSVIAHDNSTAIFRHLPPLVNGVEVDDDTLFPHGTTRVTFRVADSFGNVGSARADLFVTDLEPGDLFVGVGAPIFNTETKGAIKRIRDGALSDFCVSPDIGPTPTDRGNPDFWNRPDQIVVDAKGRVAFLAYLGLGSAQLNSWGLLRCNLPGQPPEKLAIFPQRSYVDEGWPVPLPNRLFYNVPSGLHLRRTKTVKIDDDENDGFPQIVTKEKYVLAFQDSVEIGSHGGNIGSLSLDTQSLEFQENDLGGVGIGLTTVGRQNLLPQMFYHSKLESVSFLAFNATLPVAKTYLAGQGGGVFRRIHQPFELEIEASTPVGDVKFGIQAFGGRMEIPSAPFLSDTTIADDEDIPNGASGCPDNPPIRGDFPTRQGSLAVLRSNGIIYSNVFGLVVNSGFSMPAWAGRVSEALFDLDFQNDLPSHFSHPFFGCTPTPVVNFKALTEGYDFDETGQGLWPDRMAAAPGALYGTQSFRSRVVRVTGGSNLVEVATGLLGPKGLGAFPPQLGLVSVSALIVRIDSPVDVELTDPFGHKLGVVNGAAVNELGSQGHDTGPSTHPRLYIVQHPRPGSYSLRSTGTDSGPFSVHVYSVDSEKRVTAHIVESGEASLGSVGVHDFTLDDASDIAFVNADPVANAGADQTVDADNLGTAAVLLDGSASTDPDGDPLNMMWAGPFGTVSGAQVAVTLPVGSHTLTLSVDDGRGGTAEDTVVVTVNALVSAPPSIAGAIAGRGFDASGNRYFDVRLTNVGAGPARNLRIEQLQFRTLAGSGAVSFLPSLSGALPLLVGNLDVGGSATVRLFLQVPATVRRFSLVESGTVQDVAGSTYNYSAAQSVIP